MTHNYREFMSSFIDRVEQVVERRSASDYGLGTAGIVIPAFWSATATK